MKRPRRFYAPVPMIDGCADWVVVGLRPFRYTTDEAAYRMLAAVRERDQGWHSLTICSQEPSRWWRVNMLNPRIESVHPNVAQSGSSVYHPRTTTSKGEVS